MALRQIAERAQVLFLEHLAELETRAARGQDPVGTGTPADHAADVEPALARLCAEHPPAATDQLCRNARTLTPGNDPDTRHARAHAARALRITDRGDHLDLHGQLALPDGAAVLAALDALAAPTSENDTRTAPQRHADALTDLARRHLHHGDLPTTGAVRPHVHLTIDIHDLLARGRRAGTATGVAAGHRGPVGRLGDRLRAPIGPATARRITCDPTLDITVTAPPGTAPPGTAPPGTAPPGTGRRNTGEPVTDELITALLRGLSPALGGTTPAILFAGRTTRLVTPAQRRALTIRDQGCAYPGCDRPPPWCEAHHLQHWADGGLTDLPNLVLVCARHHHTLHATGHTLTPGPDGRYTVQPEPAAPRAAA